MTDAKMTDEDFQRVRDCLEQWDQVWPDDARRLLAHADALDAENAALRALLQEALTSGMWATPSASLTLECRFCKAELDYAERLGLVGAHRADCWFTRAAVLLHGDDAATMPTARLVDAREHG